MYGTSLEPSASNREADDQQTDVVSHVVILVHGIRDFALWEAVVRGPLEQAHFTVAPTNYGRLNLLKFLTPFPFFRNSAIREVWDQIRIVRQNKPNAKLSIIAHSFGTYVVANLMRQNFDIKFERVIFCGSVVPRKFPFVQIQDRFVQPILNEVGTRDIWPAIAESITIGYGSVGTYGFLQPLLVRDRWHNGADHGFFLNQDFCKKYWIPFLRDGTILSAADNPEPPRGWLRLISVFKLKYITLLTMTCLFFQYALAWREEIIDLVLGAIGGSRWTEIYVPDPRTVGTVNDLSADLAKIERKKPRMTRDKIKQVSDELTGRLISNDSSITRVTRRQMNEKIVHTLTLLNDNDLSFVWRALPRNLDLSALNLSHVNLNGVRFDHTFLIYNNFEGANLNDVVFDHAWVRNADFSGSDLSQTKFISTDWFNALNLPGDVNDGEPIPFEEWTKCPTSYRMNPQKPFSDSISSWYVIEFDRIEDDGKADLIKAWAAYSKPGSICDKAKKER